MPNFTAGTSFTDGVTNDVTALKLNALVADAVPTSSLALNSTNGTIANFTASTANITLGTIPTLTAGTTTGTAGVFTSGTITTALIPTGTFGTTTSTAATITNGTIPTGTFGTTTSTAATITNGTIPTGTFGTTTSTAATITTGTIPTLTTGTTTSTNAVVTNGTITNLSATTSTFLGTITGSTNVVNIGSGQIYKDASGNVGIGITTGTSKLNIFGATGAANATWAGGSDVILLNNNGAFSEQAIAFQETSFAVGAKIGVKNTGNAGYDIIFANRANTSTTSSLTEKMRIDSLGNVGIGTTSPTRQLSVSGASAALGITSTAAGGNTVSIDPATTANSNTAQIDCSGANALRFNTNSAERLRIDSSGNVGIGTNGPSNKLEIVGSFGRGAPVTKTADFSLADTENWLIVNKGSSCTVTLPAASSWTGREFTIKTIQAFAVVSASSNVIPRIGGTAATAILPATDGAWATLVSNGSNREIMCGS